LTPYHAKLFAYELTAKSGDDSPDRIARALHDARVDMNPHQVNAALFALKNPLSQGVILADEVGLGKTIEAGLLLSQFWAEGKRSILIIAPKSLRHQWKDELEKLFFLKSEILNSAAYRKIEKNQEADPFEAKEKILITNEHFVDAFGTKIRQFNWDLVVIDEAHKLRNVWKKSRSQAKRAKSVRDAIRGFYKVLLTATPMQNNLMELYGLVSFIDDHILGTPESFSVTFCNIPEEQKAERLIELKKRMARFFNRELRQNVREYIQYTNRVPVTFTYTPTDSEEQLRIEFEEFLRRPIVHSIPSASMPLLKLIYLKLLASSTFALKNSLLNLYKRLCLLTVHNNDRASFEKLMLDIREKMSSPQGGRTEELARFERKLFHGVLRKDFDGLRERIEDELRSLELTDEEQEIADTYTETDSENDSEEAQDQEPLHPNEEIHEEAQAILRFISLAYDISENKKADTLIEALQTQFKKAQSEGWPEKAIIFTEFRTTQNYIIKALEKIGLSVGRDIVIFNGDSGDAQQRKDLVEEFRGDRKVFLTTEAGSEGLNLQFCNLLINYDLPWNPQRIEQRIGRCHRYGQKLDVVVVNFVNQKNGADVRVLELLQEKFNLFKGAFGASDEVLGQIESGHDFEQEILRIYLSCRSEEEIKKAFAELSEKMKSKVDKSMEDAKKVLLDNFDEEVQSKLRIQKEKTTQTLDLVSQRFHAVAKYFLSNQGIELKDDGCFEINREMPPLKTGHYRVNSNGSGQEHVIRTSDDIGAAFLEYAIESKTPNAVLEFELSNYPKKISALESLDGKSGFLKVCLASQSAFRDQQSLVFAGIDSAGAEISPETMQKLFKVKAAIKQADISSEVRTKLDELINSQLLQLNERLQASNRQVFHDEIERLDAWAEDIKLSLEIEIKQLDQQIKLLKSSAKKIDNLEEKVQAQRQVKNLESQRNEKRKELFAAQDKIDQEKEEVLSRIEQNMTIKSETKELFTIGWRIV
jgi:hypothetical protein